MDAMAKQSDHEVSWWLNEFKKMGITKVGLAEENMVSLMEDTDVPISATIMDVIMKEADWESKYPADFIKELKNNGFDEYDVLIEAASKEAFDFVQNAMKDRYQSEKYFIWPTDKGGIHYIKRNRKRNSVYRKI